MKMFHLISAEIARELSRAPDFVIVDIREPDEYDREHIPGAHSLPLSQLSGKVCPEAWLGKRLLFYCQSGNRTKQAQVLLQSFAPGDELYVLEGGLSAWRRIDGPIEQNKKAPLPLMRQVQLAVGFMVFLGVVLAYCVSPYFNLLSGFFGLGLMFAGLTGYCGLAKVLGWLPYNRRGQ